MDKAEASNGWSPEVMEKVNKDRAARELVRKQYPRLFSALSSAMFQHDPIGINFGNNTDEYDAEAGTVIPRLKDCLERFSDDCTPILR
ncbi:MAG TPA: hypothetical protein VHD56_08325 [Tepidisphaeraceae bacterium]|nr:hypothetical protein [Tepidisphaeraceae bacterium]